MADYPMVQLRCVLLISVLCICFSVTTARSINDRRRRFAGVHLTSSFAVAQNNKLFNFIYFLVVVSLSLRQSMGLNVMMETNFKVHERDRTIIIII